jgi:DNA uptake protein ComE-like DNA-binding protein
MSRLFVYPPTTIDTTGLATDTEQQAQTALLQDIENNTDGIEGTLTAIGGYVDQIEAAQTTAQTSFDSMNTSLDNIEADADALNAKLAAALVDEPHDYISMTYVGATTDINTVTYKLGGSGGATVATLTMGYDGSNRLTSVTKS